MVHQIRRDSVQAAGQLVAKCEPQLIERGTPLFRPKTCICSFAAPHVDWYNSLDPPGADHVGFYAMVISYRDGNEMLGEGGQGMSQQVTIELPDELASAAKRRGSRQSPVRGCSRRLDQSSGL